MSSYRVFRVSFSFTARDETELTILEGDELLVPPLPSGDWPDPTLWMRARNQRTGGEGDFPGTYVEFVRQVDPTPEPVPPPEPTPTIVRTPPPIPPVAAPHEHAYTHPPHPLPDPPAPAPGPGTSESPPPPPPRRGASANPRPSSHHTQSTSAIPTPGVAPKPKPRIRRRSGDDKDRDSKDMTAISGGINSTAMAGTASTGMRVSPTPFAAAASSVNTAPSIEEEDERQLHCWSEAVFQLPTTCVSCGDIIWGYDCPGYRCKVCFSPCHSVCKDCVDDSPCKPSDDSAEKTIARAVSSHKNWSWEDIEQWMKAIHIDAYLDHFRSEGITRGASLDAVGRDTLEKMTITDEVHQEVILACFDELCRPTETEEPDIGKHLKRLSAFYFPRSPSTLSLQVTTSSGKKRGDLRVNGHSFETASFATPHWCDVCGKFLWGLIRQGKQCKVCGMTVHRMCLVEGILACSQWKAGKTEESDGTLMLFGVGLSLQFDPQCQDAPTVMLKCIEAVESTGLMQQGIYRVNAPVSAIAALKQAFERDASSVDIGDPAWGDHNVFAGTLKLYLRELPDPVVPYDLYETFVSTARSSARDNLYSELQPLLEGLPSHHHKALTTLMQHLHKVRQMESHNKMSAKNLALVFGHTLIRPPPDEIFTLVRNSDAHYLLVETLILNGPWNRPEPPPLTTEPLPTIVTPPPINRSVKPIIHSTSVEDIDLHHRSPAPPPPATPGSESSSDLKDMGWYWGDISKEEVSSRLRDTPDGTFLVRDSARKPGEYTLTIRKSGTNKLIRILNSNGHYGFSLPTTFQSVQELVEFYSHNTLTKYNPKLDITLSNPISRFDTVEDGEGEEERDVDSEDLIEKLKDATDIFDSKNEIYLKMEARSEDCKKAVEKARKKVQACTLVLDLWKEQKHLHVVEQQIGLSPSDRSSVMMNVKILSDKTKESEKNITFANNEFMMTNRDFREIDRDIHTIRPELMKLQWEKDQYTSKLIQNGWSHQQISERVKEKAFSESESIYGSLYGVLGTEYASHYPTDQPGASSPSTIVPPRQARPSSWVADDDSYMSPVPPPLDTSWGAGGGGGGGGGYLNRPLPSTPGPALRPRSPVNVPGEKPHKNRTTWYMSVDRNKSAELLKGTPNGTFLCRSSASKRKGEKGEEHTHTIDVVYKDPKNASCPPSNSDIKHLKVLRQNSKYGFSVPCSHKSLEDLVLHYSERSLGVHNHGLDTTLQAPINANNPWPVPP